ncbi:MAG: hypothetical protein C0591_00710 [Marinilabiliales bacterium]|nr:MAG: hypothetical protein C0591_00710 [Marinilabiliales bacterium]
MLSKNRTLILGVILVLAVAVYLFLEYNQNNEKNYRTQLPELDTAIISQIFITLPAGAGQIVLNKDSHHWIVKSGDESYRADVNIIQALIQNLDRADVKRVASTSPDNWEVFQITDDLGTRIRFEKTDHTASDIVIGKFDYIQAKNPDPNPYNRQPQGEMLSYVRVDDEASVYAIDGMIALGLGKTMNDYRDKRIINIQKESINKLEFKYTDQLGFQLEKQNEKWMFPDGTAADSALMAKYLNSISRLRGKEFAAKDQIPSGENASLTLTYDGSKMVDVKLYMPDTSSTYIYSSQNPTTIFNDNDQKLKEKLFVSEDYFIEDK